VAAFMVSHVCWQVLSPGADISQYSVILLSFFYSNCLEISKRYEDLETYSINTILQADL